GGAGCLALGIGTGRGGGDYLYDYKYVFLIGQGRYPALVTPLLCCIFFVWLLYGPPRWRVTVPAGLFGLAAASLPLNFPLSPDNSPAASLSAGQIEFARQLERDVRAGMPPFVIALRYGIDHGYLVHLQQHPVGFYRAMRPDPAYREVTPEKLPPPDNP